jgi:sugar phosphate isomerase/epimerase
MRHRVPEAPPAAFTHPSHRLYRRLTLRAENPGMTSSLPLLGAALRSASLPPRLDWLLADQRDLELTDPLTNVFFECDWRGVARETATLLSGHAGRRGVHAPFDGLPVDSPDPRAAAVMRDRLFESLEFTALVGGTHLVLHSPFLYFGRSGSVHRGADLSAQIERVRHNLAAVVERAAAQGCTLVFENIFDLRPEPLDRLVASFQSPFVGRSLDTGHAHLMAARGAPAPDVWIDAAGELLVHVHLADNDGESDRHWACGAGTIAWPAVFRALTRLPAPPRLILEMSVPNQDASLAHLFAAGLAR